MIKYFKIVSRPYESEAEYCSGNDTEGYITDRGTSISPEDTNNYGFEPMSEDEWIKLFDREHTYDNER